MKRIIIILAALSIFTSACGTQAEPTPEFTAEDIQATAVSMAWTMAAQTMEAMPTATLIPPTETPTIVPTATITLIPATATPAATATKEGEIKMLYEWEGESTRLLFVNDTKATATISLFLSEGSNARGYWGNIPVPVLGKKQSAVVSAPKQGYYYVFAWMAGPDRNYSVEGGFGTNNPDKHEVHLTENGIKIVNP